LKQLYGTCAYSQARRVVQTFKERGTLRLPMKVEPKGLLDVSITTTRAERRYAIRMPQMAQVSGNGRLDNTDLCNGTVGGYDIVGGAMFVDHTLPPADPIIDGPTTLAGPITIRRTFSGKSPFFMRMKATQAHPDYLDGRYPGTFELELTLQ
jgi:hypothetical protein